MRIARGWRGRGGPSDWGQLVEGEAAQGFQARCGASDGTGLR